jgi:mono/diheme cytochrome c family protein
MRQRIVRFAVISATAPLCLWAAAARAQDPNRPADPPPEARQLENPMKRDGMTVDRGRKVFRVHCVPCHGTSGAGDGVMAQRLGYKPRNLTLERMNTLADGEIFWNISKGTAPMPAFE